MSSLPVRVTFFNSEIDYDYRQLFEFKTYVFYCKSIPLNIKGNYILIKTLNFPELSNESFFIQSRLVKFFPWRYIQDEDLFIYSDYRIIVRNDFFLHAIKYDFPFFLTHREGGNLGHEIARCVLRNRIPISDLNNYLYTFRPNLTSDISENGVLCLKKTNYLSFEDFKKTISIFKRDQLILPILIRNHYNISNFYLSDFRFFFVRSKFPTNKNNLKKIYFDFKYYVNLLCKNVSNYLASL